MLDFCHVARIQEDMWLRLSSSNRWWGPRSMGACLRGKWPCAVRHAPVLSMRTMLGKHWHGCQRAVPLTSIKGSAHTHNPARRHLLHTTYVMWSHRGVLMGACTVSLHTCVRARGHDLQARGLISHRLWSFILIFPIFYFSSNLLK